MADVFALKSLAGSSLFSVDDSGNVTAAGTITITGVYDILGEANTWTAEQTFGAGAALLDADTLTFGTGDDDSIQHNGTDTIWTHANGDLVFDNTDVNDPTVFRLGTDTSATTFEVRNDSDVAKFVVDGAGTVFVKGSTLDLMTGATDIKLADNNATALRVREGTNSRDYIIIDTGDGSESIQFGDAAVNPVYSFAGTGGVTFGGKLLTDDLVKATITVPNVGGGGTAARATLALKQADNSTAIASAKQVLVTASAVQYLPFLDTAAVGSVTFSAATTGTIVASGAGWALIETDATGAAAFTISNADDETIYFSVQSAASVSDLAKSCVVLASNSDAAVWSA